MQNVVVSDVFILIEMEPALSALVFRPTVPGNRQCLQTPVGKFDQVLLKRIHAECVFHLIGCEVAVRSVGLDKKFPVFTKEAGLDVEILKARVVEVAKHGLVRGMSHRAFMLGGMPKLVLSLMAAGANLAAGKPCFTGQCRYPRAVGEQLPTCDASSAKQDGDGQRNEKRFSGIHFSTPAIAFHA